MRTVLEALFWTCAGLIVWTQLGYAAALALLARLRDPKGSAAGRESAAHARGGEEALPSLSLIVAAHDEESVIGARVANALTLDYPRELLEVIVACDGCADATAAHARAAGADLVLELPRGGKIRAQDAAVERSRGAIVAFSDANALWEPDAARALVGAFADPAVGYACGQVRFVRLPTTRLPTAGLPTARGHTASAREEDDRRRREGGRREGAQRDGGRRDRGGPSAGPPSQEGVYWRYELAIRSNESRLSSITAGNGAIYATRRDAYIVVDPIMGHDLSLPFNIVKRGRRAVYVPRARATEKMVPSIAGEFARKRRMMSHTWPILLRGGMLSPRGYPPGYALMILSHRLLRYLSPFLHALVLVANVALVATGAGALYTVTLALQLALLAGALLAGAWHARPLLLARHYVLTTASPAAGLWDWLRYGTEPTWEAAEGTR